MKIPAIFSLAAAAVYLVACSSGNPTASGSAGSGGASSAGASGNGGGSGQGGAGAAGTGGTGGAGGTAGAGGRGGAGGTLSAGGRGGAGGTGGRGGAAGGGAGTSGGGGSGGAVEYTCGQHGGTCVGNNQGSTTCPNGSVTVGGLTCPINESNAVAGVHCCVSQVSGGGGAGGATGATYGCDSGTCIVGQSYCDRFSPGVPGDPASGSCRPVPASCAANSTCACLCPPGDGGSFGGCLNSARPGTFCTCTETDGKVTVNCFGA